MKAVTLLLGVAAIGLILSSRSLAADDKVIVHEWGTFTCLQDTQGNAIGSINVDDEPVPSFVLGPGFIHAASRITQTTYGSFGLPPYWDLNTKGWKPADRDVTMRLETPVIYFYPPKGTAPQSVPPLQVHVDFHGGLLSQFYPYADPNGFPPDLQLNHGQHIADFVSGLTWKNIRLGSSVKPVETDDQVWTTPREVGAPVLQADAQIYNGNRGFDTKPQAEHFLFYRGIGQLDSSLRLQEGDGSVRIWSQPWSAATVYDHAWLADIHADGTCSYRELTSFGGAASWWRPVSLTAVPDKFTPESFSAGHLTKLKASMHDALVKEGLYEDEATAMLKTWDLSYFKSPGLRFFYIVPRAWVDKVLPLSITGAPVEITRVMVGRIELISDAQRQALLRLANGPCPDLDAIKSAANDALKNSALSDHEKNLYYGGAKPLTGLGIALPPWVRDYLSLGRFRDALIIQQQQEHPSAALGQFINNNGLASAQL
jgi:hypothetical protein